MRSLRSRVDASMDTASKQYAPVKLTFEICIAINRFLASPSDLQMLHRVIGGGGPVTYVFSSPAHAQLFISKYSPADAVSANKEQTCLVEGKRAPLNNATVQHLAAAPDSAILLKEEWLEHILCGRQTWEIRSARTLKRERVALAQFGT